MVDKAILIHDVSRRLLDAYLAEPTHALLISGARGSGAGTIASHVASQLVSHDTQIFHIAPDEKNTISIETIRDLYVLTRNKKTDREVIVIDQADKMSHDAQQAFLKLLEEPTDMTSFILTSHQPEVLLPTIFSRLQHIQLRPVSSAISENLAKKLSGDPQKIKQLLFLANGLPAEIYRLASNTEYFDAKSSIVSDAQKLMTGDPYARLVAISKYSKRPEATELVDTLGHLLSFILSTKPTAKLHELANTTEKVASALNANGHVRTQLMKLALS